MEKKFVAQELIKRLSKKIRGQINLQETLILGVVLKGMPVAYSLAKASDMIENFVPLVAQRHIYMQHQVESYFPSSEWKDYFNHQLSNCKNLLIVDDVVNTGFTKEKVESIVCSLNKNQEFTLPQIFAALVLNRENLGNPHFVNSNDFFAIEVNATNVECDWGIMTVPLWDLPVETARQRCEEYHQRFWQNEKRWITITY
jgi:hypoxanthine-guanine phosphoribosyltransferase